MNQADNSIDKKIKYSQLFKRETVTVKSAEPSEVNFGLSKWSDTNLSAPVLSLLNNNSEKNYFYKYLKLREGLFSLPMYI